MPQKEHIEAYISGLLESAEARGTEQGRLVCRRALNALSEVVCQADIVPILDAFNRVYVGIEAHGHLTQYEFSIVQELREIESLLK